jgi:hypothetical protein
MKKEKNSFTVEANRGKHEMIKQARGDGLRIGKKLVSCTLAFEMGADMIAQILGLDRGENSESNMHQALAEIQEKKAQIAAEEQVALQQLEVIEATKSTQLSEAAVQNNNVQLLAQKIMGSWDKIIFYKDYRYPLVESMVEIDRTRLKFETVSSVFPKIYRESPSLEEAISIAISLLDYEGEGVAV